MRLDLAAIEAAIRASATLDPDEARRLVEGYRYVDELLARAVPLFDYGQSQHLLELNHRVLCGTSPERRRQYADHLAETERWFYDRPHAGVAELREWYQRRRTNAAPILAAGAMVQVVSQPQLFIEGNRRTSALIASWILGRAGLPPFVPTAATLPAWRTLLERASLIERGRISGGIAAFLVTRRLAELVIGASDARFLKALASAGTPGAGG